MSAVDRIGLSDLVRAEVIRHCTVLDVCGASASTALGGETRWFLSLDCGVVVWLRVDGKMPQVGDRVEHAHGG